jgi:hypothetical protein
LREVIAACGGAARVAATLWPHIDAPTAHRRLLDCLNPGRPARLDPDCLRRLLRLGHRVGCHVAIDWLMFELGYEAVRPLPGGDGELAALTREYEAAKARLANVQRRIGVRRE